LAINPVGTITGYYSDCGSTPHGFLRAPNGKFTTFDPPGPLFYQQQIYPQAINPAGAVAGFYTDASFVFHGFLRTPIHRGQRHQPGGSNHWILYRKPTLRPVSLFPAGPNGKFTTFDYPGSSQGIFAYAIDPAGTITGSYAAASSVYHGFLRAANGKFTTFDPPGSQITTSPSAINPSGAITGSYYDANYFVNFLQHGFLRSAPDE
jgi:hypothetical protein